jgi:hypothetical protein
MGAAVFEDLPENWRVTWIAQLEINRIFHVVEKGFEAGVAVALGALFGAFGEPG